MLEKNGEERVSLEDFSKLVGLPIEIIKNELFSKEEATSDVSITELRKVMLNYLNETMLNS